MAEQPVLTGCHHSHRHDIDINVEHQFGGQSAASGQATPRRFGPCKGPAALGPEGSMNGHGELAAG